MILFIPSKYPLPPWPDNTRPSSCNKEHQDTPTVSKPSSPRESEECTSNDAFQRLWHYFGKLSAKLWKEDLSFSYFTKLV